MATAADVAAFRDAQNVLSDAAARSVRQLADEARGLAPAQVRDLFLDTVPSIVDVFGEASAELAAEYFEQLTGYAVPTVRGAPAAAVQAQVRYRAGHLFTGDVNQFLSSLALDADKYVKSHGRNTIYAGAQSRGVRYARVPSGSKTCAFCIMLASRDAVYMTREAAGARDTGNEYHGHCDCVVTPMRSADDYPEGYDPDELYDTYMAAREAAGSGNIDDIVKAARREFPDRFTDGVK